MQLVGCARNHGAFGAARCRALERVLAAKPDAGKSLWGKVRCRAARSGCTAELRCRAVRASLSSCAVELRGRAAWSSCAVELRCRAVRCGVLLPSFEDNLSYRVVLAELRYRLCGLAALPNFRVVLPSCDMSCAV